MALARTPVAAIRLGVDFLCRANGWPTAVELTKVSPVLLLRQIVAGFAVYLVIAVRLGVVIHVVAGYGWLLFQEFPIDAATLRRFF